MSKLSPFVFIKQPYGITAVRKDRDENVFNKKHIDDMDVAHPDGKYVTPGGTVPRLRIQDMHKFCKQHGKQPKDLTEEELTQFRY